MADETYQPGSMPEVFQLIERIEKKLKQMERQTTRAADLTPPQYVVLRLLWEKDRRAFKELAAASYCTPATTTGIVDTLERKGLVTRQPNLDDRRSLLVALTEKGKSLQSSTSSIEMVFDDCCTSLEPNEIRQLCDLLKKLEDALFE